MSELVTRCPSCQVTFKATRAQMQAANGLVRCGACLNIFDAYQHLLKKAAEDPPPAVATTPGQASAVDDEQANATPDTSATLGEQPSADFYFQPRQSPLPEDNATTAADPTDSTASHPALCAADFTEQDAENLAGADSVEIWPHPKAPASVDDDFADILDTDEGHALDPASSGSGVGDNQTSGRPQASAEIPDELESFLVFEGPETDPGSDALYRPEPSARRLLPQDPDAILSLPLARHHPPLLATPDTATAPDSPDTFSTPIKAPVKRSSRPRPEKRPFEDFAGLGETKLAVPPLSGHFPPRADAASSDVAWEPQEASSRAWLWLVTGVLAAVLLLGQYIYFNRDILLKDPDYRPWLERVCESFNCNLPVLVDRSRISTKDFVVRSHPEYANALLVNAVIVNNASFDQPFPDLSLQFEDLQGKIVAQRRFQPGDYLKGELTGAVFMPVHQPIRLELEILDPGQEAVSYSLFIPD